MRIRSGRAVMTLWAGALSLFLLSAWASTALLPSAPATRPGASYYVGLVGLLAIGLALVLTWSWARHTIPATRGTLAVRALLPIVAVLWLLAMVFPFL